MKSKSSFIKVLCILFTFFSIANFKICYSHLETSKDDKLAANRTQDNKKQITDYIANHPCKDITLPREIIEYISSFQSGQSAGDWLDYILFFPSSIEDNIIIFRNQIKESFASLIVEVDDNNANKINIKPLQNIYYLAPKFFNPAITYALREILLEVIAENKLPISTQYCRCYLMLPMFSIYNKTTQTLSILDEKYKLLINNVSQDVLYEFIIQNQSSTISQLIIKDNTTLAKLFVDIVKEKGEVITTIYSLFLPNLTSLNLSFNKIGDAGAKEISLLTNLTTLDLRSNQIGDAGAEDLSLLTNLTTLNLCNNQIGAVGAKEISMLTNLISLDLSWSEIGAAGAKEISLLTNLTTLDLFSNQIGDAGAKEISKITNLTTLNLHFNQIGSAGAKEISLLTNLTTLNLHNNQIGDAGAKEISKITNLTTLNLRLNQIGDAGAKEISRLTNLISLKLIGNKIGDAGAKELSLLTNLTTLDLRANQIGYEMTDKLKEILKYTRLEL